MAHGAETPRPTAWDLWIDRSTRVTGALRDSKARYGMGSAVTRPSSSSLSS